MSNNIKQNGGIHMREQKRVYVEKLNPDISLPTYANETDAGMDVRAAQDILIKPQETKIIPTGLRVAIPDGFEIQVRARSGVSFKTPLRISNGIGTIDNSYRGEIGIIITNTSEANAKTIFVEPMSIDNKGNLHGSYLIKKGDRIAQLVLSRVPQIVWEEVSNVEEIGENRGGGYGSSGTT
jgi:dUTP pyrophosphatase